MQIKNINEILHAWREQRRAKLRAQRQCEIKRTFQVTELNGSLYLTCNGIPYKEVANGETSKQITDRLNDARNAMRSYMESKESDGEQVLGLGRGYLIVHTD